MFQVQRLLNMQPLHLAQSKFGAAVASRWFFFELQVQVAWPDRFSSCKQNGSFDHVLQFPDVSGPGVGGHRLHGLVWQREMKFPHIGSGTVKEVPGENRQILQPFPQSRHENTDCAHTKIQIAAESFLSNHVRQVFMTGSNQSDVKASFLDISEPAETLFFKDLEQLGLNLYIHVSNFVEKHGPRCAISSRPSLR